MEREHEKPCSYFKKTINDLWLRRDQIYWFYQQHIAEIYQLLYFFLKENGPPSRIKLWNGNCSNSGPALLFDLSQCALWEGMNEEAAQVSLTAVLVQHPGIACKTTRASYHSSVSAALMEPNLMGALNFPLKLQATILNSSTGVVSCWFCC